MVEHHPLQPDSHSITLEANQRLSQSRLWQMQRQFFEQQGIQAWNTGKVPHYVTSSPYIARAYSNVVVGFLRDCLASGQRVAPHQKSTRKAQPSHENLTSQLALDVSQPFYIIELGAGSGRFAYHVLKHLFADVAHPVLEQVTLKYVMTDFAQTNVDFWQAHPFLQPYLERGVLDFAQFDFAADTAFQLIHSGITLSADTLQNPLVVFANYFFDSIPQDLFALKQGRLYETLVTLGIEETGDRRPETGAVKEEFNVRGDLLESLHIDFTDHPVTPNYYDDPDLNQLLEHYQQQFDDTSLLLPTTALEGLVRLRHLSRDRLLLLTADKGYSREEDLRYRAKPKLVFHHGCFSLSVNYHALAQYTQNADGRALTLQHPSGSIQICGFLFGLPDAGETQQSFQQYIQTAGPDDFFALKKSLEPHYASLELPQILAYLRFSGWDSNVFLGCFPTLMAQVATAPQSLKQELVQAIEQIWDTYYWIGEDKDLALHLARLLVALENFDPVLTFANRSMQLYGENSEALWLQTLCYVHLGQTSDALVPLQRILENDPDHALAQVLLQDLTTNPEADESVRDWLQSTVINSDESPMEPLSRALLSLKLILEHSIENRSVPFSPDLLAPGLVTLTQLGVKFQLSDFEQLILLLALGLEVEPAFQALCAKAQGNSAMPYVTLGLALSILPKADWSILSPQNPLHYWQLIHTEPGRLLTQAPVQIDRRILCFLLGEASLDSRLEGWVTPISLSQDPDVLPASYRALSQKIVNVWTASSVQPLPVIGLTGADAMTREQLAVMACDAMGFQLMALPMAILPTDPQELTQLQRHWQREAILRNSVLLLNGGADMGNEPALNRAVSFLLETLTTPVIVSSNQHRPQLQRTVIPVDVPPLPHKEQTALWQAYLGDAAASFNGQIEVVANQFKLTPAAIQTICHQFQLRPTDTPEDGNDVATTKSLLAVQASFWSLCRSQARPDLDSLAQRVHPAADWDDLILPRQQRQVLEDIATHLRHCALVYHQWGFAQKGDRSLGISALFHGESGTGKTMAAEVLAQECQLDLYRIDLSAVVSKYIGETEKNLRRIFDAAETGGAILLFDEADALFGKRTEVKDSHDRHANVEVSYLLQRMETYQGLAILTSNLKNNLDNAFLRRLRFIVQFPFPNAQSRAKIWQHIFPSQTPTKDLDFKKLGQLNVSGGSIRNIALNAAFLAAQAEQPVTMQHIHQAAQRDYVKLERLLTTEELKGWDLSK